MRFLVDAQLPPAWAQFLAARGHEAKAVREVQDAVFASYLIRLRVRSGVLPEYVFCYFQSPEYWSVVGGGIDDGNRPNMNGSKLAELLVLFP